jgi:uncharacterized protein YjiS (DUF1127 family)
MNEHSSLPNLSMLVPSAYDRYGGWSIWAWLARWRERRNLRDLSDATLRDIGLTRADIEDEIDRLRW